MASLRFDKHGPTDTFVAVGLGLVPRTFGCGKEVNNSTKSPIIVFFVRSVLGSFFQVVGNMSRRHVAHLQKQKEQILTELKV